jgi:hypothetical protein
MRGIAAPDVPVRLETDIVDQLSERTRGALIVRDVRDVNLGVGSFRERASRGERRS